jgi:hypothetical protein
MTTMMSVNEGGGAVVVAAVAAVAVDIDGVYEDSSPGQDDGGAPRHSSRFAAVPRSLSRSASMQGVADNILIVALKRRENGRMTVCLSRVSFFAPRRGGAEG